MPYIKQLDRDYLDSYIEQLAAAIFDLGVSPGNINYCITKLTHKLSVDPSYHTINEIVGALECVKLEYYRKIAAPYEDQKEFENGKI